MIYELRVYHTVPGRLPALVKRFDTITCGLFEKHGIKQVGFWTVVIGNRAPTWSTCCNSNHWPIARKNGAPSPSTPNG